MLHRLPRQFWEIVLALTTAALLSGSSCHGGAGVAAVSTTGVSPGRFHNAVRVEHASQNLADAVEAQCGAGNPKAATAASQARAAAQNIESAIDLFNDTPPATDRVTNAIDAAHKANEAAYNQYLACGGIPPPGAGPGHPGWSESFWDVSS